MDIVLFRFVFRVNIAETAGWAAFVFLQVTYTLSDLTVPICVATCKDHRLIEVCVEGDEVSDVACGPAVV